jgi:DNA-binding transcriptional regulator YiaG
VQYRRDLAALKREAKTLNARVAQFEKRVAERVTAAPVAEPTETVRFSAKRLRSQRKRLGLSAAEYGKLVGVTPLSIYNWERGVVRPRREWLSILASLRPWTKKQARERLEQLARKPAGRRRRS